MAATGEDTAAPPPAMVVGLDDSEHSFYALEWTLRHFFPGCRGGTSSPQPFKLVIVHAKPSPASVIGLAGPGAAEALPYVESDLKRIAATVVQKAKELCDASSVGDVVYEVVEGDARNVLCQTVEKHHADILAVGSHGYGAIKRATSFENYKLYFLESNHEGSSTARFMTGWFSGVSAITVPIMRTAL